MGRPPKKKQNNIINVNKIVASLPDDSRRGPLSTQEKLFIEQNCSTKHIAEIAAEIKRNERSVAAYIKEKNLVSIDFINRSPEDQELVNQLHSYSWWPSVNKQFDDEETRFFENFWIRLYKQFDYDILPSEESQIIKFITFEIMKNRNRFQVKKLIDEEEMLENEYKKEIKLSRESRDPLVIQDLSTRLSGIKSIAPNLNKEFIELSKEQEKIGEGLSAKRNDRIKNIQDATKNWSNILKLLEDPEVRRQIGKHMEIMKLARDKEMVRMTKLHKYVDGEFDVPMLSGRLEEFYEYNDSKNKE